MLLLMMLSLSYSIVSGQWTKVSSNNIGISGRMLATNSSVYFYGKQGGFTLYRSSDNGNTWTDIAGKFPYDVYYMYYFNNEIFAVTTTLGASVYRFYVSQDEGATWSERSNIPSVTGNGAILSMASDGPTLYACSNRKSYYVSNDNGLTWNENTINLEGAANVIMMTASGSDLVAVFTGLGTVASTDGGQTWNTKNPAGTAISVVYSFKGTIYGLSFGAGVYKWNKETKDWIAINNGIPDGGSLQIPYAIVGYGNTVYVATRGLLSTQTILLSSTDEGSSWSLVSLDGLPALNGSPSSTFMAANATDLYLTNYIFASGTSDNEATGVFKMPVSVTALENAGEIPAGFILEQNYPNPFNPETTIRFSIPISKINDAGTQYMASQQTVSLKVHDILGREIATLVSGVKSSGIYEVKFDASGLPSGIYFYELHAGQYSAVKKMILMK